MREKLITFSFIAVIGGFFLWNVFVPDTLVSNSERRKLQKFPEITWEQVQNKNVMNAFDRYTLDQFVLRDSFRSLKAHIVLDGLQMLDFNQFFIKNDVIYKSEYPNNEESIKRFISKLSTIQNKYLTGNKVYYSIIPDKSYYVDDTTYLLLDYDALYNQVISGLSHMEFIDLRDVLSIQDYYRTDTHWREENLEKVVSTLGNHMGFTINTSYEENKYEPFYGVYYGQAAVKMRPDELVYLTNDELEQVIVTNYEKNSVLYDIKKLGSMDSYDVFLGGATPLVTIENPNQTNEKELIIFRDSFGSSLVPLLVPAYSKITLIDLRYITTNKMEELVTFENQDVLFLYSTLLVNDSSSLRD